MAWSDDVVMVEDDFKKLDSILRMNKMTASITYHCSNSEDSTIRGIHKIL
jgi:hypothetical protein